MQKISSSASDLSRFVQASHSLLQPSRPYILSVLHRYFLKFLSRRARNLPDCRVGSVQRRYYALYILYSARQHSVAFVNFTSTHTVDSLASDDKAVTFGLT
ncbi:hypothetical protein PUN28_010380 [Cardiocondyla obscurior]|uniref:Uncharacterized protein n=1 Tax=Cardiocondyla obscurior TaxID=286306 RepID=A0AAW2FNJ0_9HYME